MKRRVLTRQFPSSSFHVPVGVRNPLPLQDQHIFLVRNVHAGADLLTRKRLLMCRAENDAKRPALALAASMAVAPAPARSDGGAGAGSLTRDSSSGVGTDGHSCNGNREGAGEVSSSFSSSAAVAVASSSTVDSEATSSPDASGNSSNSSSDGKHSGVSDNEKTAALVLMDVTPPSEKLCTESANETSSADVMDDVVVTAEADRDETNTLEFASEEASRGVKRGREVVPDNAGDSGHEEQDDGENFQGAVTRRRRLAYQSQEDNGGRR